ncbi:hypothetical protein PMI07_006421 [Rhizobium sp. CF080]|nr:hypothetical protein PMI07_006421 [Rhizobium sp. CF080]
MIKCKDRRNTGGVCEAHPTRPWTGTRGCGCGTAGMRSPRYSPELAWDTPPDVSRLRSVTYIAGNRPAVGAGLARLNNNSHSHRHSHLSALEERAESEEQMTEALRVLKCRYSTAS